MPKDVGDSGGILSRDRGGEHRAHQEDALLWSNEEHVQKGFGAPQYLGLTEHLLRHGAVRRALR